jgi:hypothetical protein
MVSESNGYGVVSLVRLQLVMVVVLISNGSSVEW